MYELSWNKFIEELKKGRELQHSNNLRSGEIE